MHRRGSDSALRHLDFLVCDILVMQFSFILMYWITRHAGLIYLDPAFRVQPIIFFSAQMALGMFSDVYDHVFTRNTYKEFGSLLLSMFEIWLLGGVFIFLAGIQVRVTHLLGASFIYFDLAFFLRQWNKRRHLRKGLPKRRIAIVARSGNISTIIRRISENKTTADYEAAGVLLLDHSDPAAYAYLGIPVFDASSLSVLDEIAHWWIDDVFLLLEKNDVYPKQLMERFLLMGITIHTSLSVLDEFAFSKTDVRELGSYQVLSNSINFVSDRSALVKRAADIIGGFFGTLATGLLFLFIAPAIYIKSPGPIFFSQQRIGQNGRVFRIYKFRSMYMDAEKRKAELMEKNKLQNDLMFKMDDDPRIIGSEKKGKDGKPKGIGNFIRNTSLDEFPQFFNVLKGDMSLVGTRPPTLDEWKNYDPRHRVRMSAKPGITGMWQVCGRSEITDFEQVVDLDRRYLENWSLALDIKILVKTIKVVLKHEGAS
ncbi:MAG: sugar transferase [Clostridia bacterium]|nr:sugar transferase [Clostridia bacterium]